MASSDCFNSAIRGLTCIFLPLLTLQYDRTRKCDGARGRHRRRTGKFKNTRRVKSDIPFDNETSDHAGRSIGPVVEKAASNDEILYGATHDWGSLDETPGNLPDSWLTFSAGLLATSENAIVRHVQRFGDQLQDTDPLEPARGRSERIYNDLSGVGACSAEIGNRTYVADDGKTYIWDGGAWKLQDEQCAEKENGLDLLHIHGTNIFYTERVSTAQTPDVDGLNAAHMPEADDAGYGDFPHVDYFQAQRLSRDEGTSSSLSRAEGATKRVRFNDSMTTVAEITPYSEIYGVHPRFFDFAVGGIMQYSNEVDESGDEVVESGDEVVDADAHEVCTTTHGQDTYAAIIENFRNLSAADS